MSRFEQLKIDNQLCHAVYSAANALTRFYNNHLKALKLTYPQYIVMLSLWEKDGVNIQAISDQTLFDSGTLTPLLQKLKTLGFIEILVDERDRRQKVIRVTRKGRNLEEKASMIPGQLACHFPFGLEEALQLKSLARTLQISLAADEAKEETP